MSSLVASCLTSETDKVNKGLAFRNSRDHLSKFAIPHYQRETKKKISGSGGFDVILKIGDEFGARRARIGEKGRSVI